MYTCVINDREKGQDRDWEVNESGWGLEFERKAKRILKGLSVGVGEVCGWVWGYC
jgi:hypothetical protein